jgi:hypothetical protein
VRHGQLLQDFKVIPSSIRPSALKLGDVVVCCFYNITALSALWSLRHLIFGKSHDAAACQGVSIADWIFYLFDVTCFVMWWVAFSLLALNPDHHTGVSLVACWTAYRYLFAIYRHPISCRLPRDTTRRKLLTVAVLWIGMVQWIATCYVVHVKYYDFDCDIDGAWAGEDCFGQRYDCLLSQLPTARGTTNCTGEDLRSKSWLFGNPSFEYADRAISVAPATFYIMSAWSGLAICAIFAETFLHERADRFWNLDGGINGILRMTEMFMILALVTVSIVVWSWTLISGTGPSDRDAVVTYDLECHALHVTLSPWKDYLDVNAYGRAYRIGRAWFNT